MPATYKLITATSLSNNTTTNVSFNSIPSTYQHLVIKIQAKSSDQVANNGFILTDVKFNGAASNYWVKGWYTNSNNVTLSNFGATSALSGFQANPSIINDYTPSQPGRGYMEMTIPYYRTSGRMMMLWKGGFTQRIGASPFTYMARNWTNYCMINSTGPLTDISITVATAWLSGSTFRLYGLTSS